MKKYSSLVIIIILSDFSFGYAAHGTATYYTPPYQPSACYGFHGMGSMIGAASDAIWDNRAACGRFYRVKCKGSTNGGPSPCKKASIVIKIIDYCPPGSCYGTIDLSQKAFEIIADPKAGKIRIDFTPAHLGK